MSIDLFANPAFTQQIVTALIQAICNDPEITIEQLTAIIMGFDVSQQDAADMINEFAAQIAELHEGNQLSFEQIKEEVIAMCDLPPETLDLTGL